MQFTHIPTEQTTAITDLIISIMSAIFAHLLYKKGSSCDKNKAVIWTSAYGLLAIASFLGALIHGFVLDDKFRFILWLPLNLMLAFAVGLFVVGVVYDMKGYGVLRKIMALMLGVVIIIYALTLLYSGAFIIFILYELMAMLFSFVAYFILAYRNKYPGAGYMTLGILITIIAAIVQTRVDLRLQMIWSFNHNGIFHLIQIPGLVLIFLGLQKAFDAKEFCQRPA